MQDSVLAIDMGRSIRDTFVATNGCGGEEQAAPAPGSASDHVKTEYSCTEEPVVWIAHGGDHIPDPDFAPEETWSFWEPFFSTGGGAAAAGGNGTAAVTSAAAAASATIPARQETTLATSSVAAVPPVQSVPGAAPTEVPVEAGAEECEIVYV